MGGNFAVAHAGASIRGGAASGFAQANVFAGKTITPMVGLAPGGGADGKSRVGVPCFPKFISGDPTGVPFLWDGDDVGEKPRSVSDRLSRVPERVPQGYLNDSHEKRST